MPRARLIIDSAFFYDNSAIAWRLYQSSRLGCAAVAVGPRTDTGAALVKRRVVRRPDHGVGRALRVMNWRVLKVCGSMKANWPWVFPAMSIFVFVGSI